MCGRFARNSTQKVLAGWFGIDIEDMPFFGTTYNAAPQTMQPVVRLSCDENRREFALLRWGLVPFWAKDAKFGYSTINARAEEAASKPAFREAVKNRRCLIPADAFYEWQQTGRKTKVPFAIALRSGEPHALAGLWERWQPPQQASTPPAPPLETFTILTTDPNELMEPFHNRMPVILEPKDYDRWLGAGEFAPGDPARPPIDLMRTYPAEKMAAWPVSDRVGNVRNNDPQLLDEVQPQVEESAPQPGLLFPEG